MATPPPMKSPRVSPRPGRMASPSQEASAPSAHVDPTGADAYIKRLREECDNKRKDNVRLLQDLQRCIKSQNKFSRKESVWQHEKEVMQAQHMAEAAALRGEMQAAREDAHTLHADNARLNFEFTSLQQQLEHADAALQQHQQRLQEREQYVAHLEAHLQQASEASKAQQQLLDQKDRQLQAAAAADAEKQQQMQQANEQLQQAQRQAQQQDEQLQSSAARVAGLEAQLKEQVATARQEAAEGRKLQGKLQQLQETCSHTEQNLQQAQQQLQKALTAQLQLQFDCSSKDEQLQEAAKRLSAARQELQDVQRSKDQQASELQQQLSASTAKDQQLAASAAELMAANQQLTALQEASSSKDVQLAASAAELAAAQQELRSASSSKDEQVADLARQLQDVQQQLVLSASSTQEGAQAMATLQGQLKDAQQACSGWEQQVRQAQQDLAGKEQQSASLHQQVQELQRGADSGSKQVAELRAQLQEVQEASSSKEQQLQAVQQELQQAQEASSSKEQQWQAAHQQLQQLQEASNTKEPLLAAAQQELQALTAAHAQLQQQLQQASEVSSKQDQDLAAAQEQLQELTAAHAALEQQLTAAQEAAAKAITTNAAAQTTGVEPAAMEQLQQQLAEAQKARERLHQELQEVQVDREQLLPQLEALQAQLATSRQVCASSSEGRDCAQKQLAILQAELEDVQGQLEAATAAKEQLGHSLAESDQALSQMWFERNMYRLGEMLKEEELTIVLERLEQLQQGAVDPAPSPRMAEAQRRSTSIKLAINVMSDLAAGRPAAGAAAGESEAPAGEALQLLGDLATVRSAVLEGATALASPAQSVQLQMLTDIIASRSAAGQSHREGSASHRSVLDSLEAGHLGSITSRSLIDGWLSARAVAPSGPGNETITLSRHTIKMLGEMAARASSGGSADLERYLLASPAAGPAAAATLSGQQRQQQLLPGPARRARPTAAGLEHELSSAEALPLPLPSDRSTASGRSLLGSLAGESASSGSAAPRSGPFSGTAKKLRLQEQVDLFGSKCQQALAQEPGSAEGLAASQLVLQVDSDVESDAGSVSWPAAGAALGGESEEEGDDGSGSSSRQRHQARPSVVPRLALAGLKLPAVAAPPAGTAAAAAPAAGTSGAERSSKQGLGSHRLMDMSSARGSECSGYSGYSGDSGDSDFTPRDESSSSLPAPLAILHVAPAAQAVAGSAASAGRRSRSAQSDSQLPTLAAAAAAAARNTACSSPQLGSPLKAPRGHPDTHSPAARAALASAQHGSGSGRLASGARLPKAGIPAMRMPSSSAPGAATASLARQEAQPSPGSPPLHARGQRDTFSGSAACTTTHTNPLYSANTMSLTSGSQPHVPDSPRHSVASSASSSARPASEIDVQTLDERLPALAAALAPDAAEEAAQVSGTIVSRVTAAINRSASFGGGATRSQTGTPRSTPRDSPSASAGSSSRLPPPLAPSQLQGTPHWPTPADPARVAADLRAAGAAGDKSTPGWPSDCSSGAASPAGGGSSARRLPQLQRHSALMSAGSPMRKQEGITEAGSASSVSPTPSLSPASVTSGMSAAHSHSFTSSSARQGRQGTAAVGNSCPLPRLPPLPSSSSQGNGSTLGSPTMSRALHELLKMPEESEQEAASAASDCLDQTPHAGSSFSKGAAAAGLSTPLSAGGSRKGDSGSGRLDQTPQSGSKAGTGAAAEDAAAGSGSRRKLVYETN